MKTANKLGTRKSLMALATIAALLCWWFGDVGRRSPSTAVARLFAVARNSPPAFKTQTAKLDLGSVPQGQPVRATFAVQNCGGRRLTMRRKDGSCECAAGGRAEVIIPPGHTNVVTAVVDTRHLCGAFRLKLPYATNDPDAPEVVFEILVEVNVTSS